MTSPNGQFDVIVIGGGASGMMAAGTAASNGKRVLLLEKNRTLGEKLKITGGGRCNITNAEYDQEVLLRNYGTAKDFLYSPFSQFGIKDTFTFFESRGLPLIVEARKRAFPASHKALDVYKTMEKYIKTGGVTVKTDARVERIETKNDRITGVVASGKQYQAHSYIFATGGLSHPETGSTGDGFSWLQKIGHTVKKPTPTIVPLAVEDAWVKSLPGISLTFMKITFFADGKKAFSKTGKILFTHFGFSGPLILNSAGKVHDLLLSSAEVTARIDCYPDTELGALNDKIVAVFDANKNKMLKNIFTELVPPGTAQAILSLLSIDTSKKVHSITKEERKEIVHLLKALPATISGIMGFDRAVVADGGVDLREIDTRTMRSKKYDNLFVTGDLLNITRPSGGYSLQLCWTTGYVAGQNI